MEFESLPSSKSKKNLMYASSIYLLEVYFFEIWCIIVNIYVYGENI